MELGEPIAILLSFEDARPESVVTEVGGDVSAEASEVAVASYHDAAMEGTLVEAAP